MANHYLRYKYFFVTRMTSEELYAVAKGFFASLNVLPEPKLSTPLHTEANPTLDADLKFGASVAELIKVVIDLALNLNMLTEADLKGTISTGIRPEERLVFEPEPHFATGYKTEAKSDIAFEFTRPNIGLIRFVFKPVVEPMEHYLNVYPSEAKLSSPIETEFFEEHSTDMSAEITLTVLVTPIHTECESLFRCREIVEPHFATGYKTEAKSDIASLLQPYTEMKEGNTREALLENECTVEPFISLFGVSKLSDLDDILLSEMDERTLDKLDITEIN